MPRADDFRAARNASIAELKVLEREAADQVLKLLEESDREITRLLASQPTDYQRWRLAELQVGVRGQMADFGRAAAAAANGKADAWWRAGIQAVDAPLAAGEIRLAAMFANPDPRQLLAMRSFMTSRIEGISADLVGRINREIGQVVTGLKDPFAAIDAVRSQLEGGTGRALTVVRTELGRAYSTANQERMLQAGQALPGLRKQWRRSGKLESRITHDLADGQVKAPSEPFLVGGERLMYPRDPDATPKNTVNCGCISLPLMESWEVRSAGALPFTDAELAGSQNKRRVAQLRGEL
ncbi:MAG: hypothetical protein WD341_08795 [Tistlia sp.]|uniref:hypothetical protein n=1 Tax=Tistlia sp. TaxID=3057121 RepID=UPI0034A54CF5